MRLGNKTLRPQGGEWTAREHRPHERRTLPTQNPTQIPPGSNRRGHGKYARQLEALMHGVAFKSRSIQRQFAPQAQRKRAPGRVLEHLVAEATDDLGNDHGIVGCLFVMGVKVFSEAARGYLF
jgi:hypothetical protein